MRPWIPTLLLAGCHAGPIPVSPPAVLLARPPSLPAPIEGRAAKPKEAALSRPAYPATRRQALSETKFGVTLTDPYRWLEDGKAPEVQAWLAEQDRFARADLDALPGRDALAARLRALYYVDSVSTPRRRGARLFYTRTHADREKAVAYWREGESGPEHVLLDPNTMSSDGSVSLGTWVASWDGARVAYAIKRNNSDEATLHVIEVATGKVSEIDVIEGAKYAHPSWTPAGDGFYYTYLPNEPGVSVADRPGLAEVRFHRLGTDPKADPVVHPRTGNPQTFIQASLSRDGRWLIAYIQHGWNSTDVYLQDRRPTPKGAKPRPAVWQPLAVGLDAQLEIEAWRDQLYVRTNLDAPRWRVLRVDPLKPAREHWREVVPQSPDAVLEDLSIVGGKLGLLYLKRAASQLELRDLDGGNPRPVALPEIGASGGFAGNPEDDVAYYGFNSFTRPSEVHRLAIGRLEDSVWARVTLPIDPSRFVVEQVEYPSRDGTRVTMFVVHRRDLVRDGKTPMLLGGYGGFNVSMTPTFRSAIYPWLEAGGSYAVPNLRGGGEYGEQWHRDGMGPRKQNTFDDFIAAAELLVREGYTSPAKLVIRGGSNGGLLVGAAITQRPDLFRAAVCAVPLLDMLRYHLFGSGKTWIPEYGSADDEAGFKAIAAYSPYQKVVDGTAYPAVLMMTADSDDRVDPMHARKMAAALQAAGKGPGRTLLRVEKQAGHGGADLVRQAVAEWTDIYAFLMREVGLAPAPPPTADGLTR